MKGVIPITKNINDDNVKSRAIELARAVQSKLPHAKVFWDKPHALRTFWI